ncbi:MAG: alpha-L-rhamnosidase, partial [Cytophagaceae bacterium BCCC1]
MLDRKGKWITIVFLLSIVSQVFAGFTLDNLKVDYENTPLGIDITNPHFSWQMKATDNKRGYAQTAYQIVVTDANNQIVWDTQKVNSDLSHGIEYSGPALKATTRYTWKVSVWDNLKAMTTKSSWFETGLMNPDISAWSGAKWIGGGSEDLVFYSHYLSVYKFQYAVQLDKATNSTKASFIFGGNDARLMDKDLNIQGVENQKDQSYIALELDISTVSESP